MHDLEGGDDVGHLRHPQQPTQPDDLDRHTDSRQRVVHICGCRVVAHQHADVAPARGRHGPVCTRNRIGQELKLVLVGLEHSRPNPAGKGFAFGSRGCTPVWLAYSSVASSLAVCRICRSERRLTLSGKRDTWPVSARGKADSNCSMLLTDAPRQP